MIMKSEMNSQDHERSGPRGNVFQLKVEDNLTFCGLPSDGSSRRVKTHSTGRVMKATARQTVGGALAITTRRTNCRGFPKLMRGILFIGLMSTGAMAATSSNSAANYNTGYSGRVGCVANHGSYKSRTMSSFKGVRDVTLAWKRNTYYCKRDGVHKPRGKGQGDAAAQEKARLERILVDILEKKHKADGYGKATGLRIRVEDEATTKRAKAAKRTMMGKSTGAKRKEKEAAWMQMKLDVEQEICSMDYYQDVHNRDRGTWVQFYLANIKKCAICFNDLLVEKQRKMAIDDGEIDEMLTGICNYYDAIGDWIKTHTNFQKTPRPDIVWKKFTAEWRKKPTSDDSTVLLYHYNKISYELACIAALFENRPIWNRSLGQVNVATERYPQQAMCISRLRDEFRTSGRPLPITVRIFRGKPEVANDTDAIFTIQIDMRYLNFKSTKQCLIKGKNRDYEFEMTLHPRGYLTSLKRWRIVKEHNETGGDLELEPHGEIDSCLELAEKNSQPGKKKYAGLHVYITRK